MESCFEPRQRPMLSSQLGSPKTPQVDAWSHSEWRDRASSWRASWSGDSSEFLYTAMYVHSLSRPLDSLYTALWWPMACQLPMFSRWKLGSLPSTLPTHLSSRRQVAACRIPGVPCTLNER